MTEKIEIFDSTLRDGAQGEGISFSVDDKHLRRAGLDYWDKLSITYYDSIEEFYEKNPRANVFYFTTKGRTRHVDVRYEGDVYLMFGPESRGLPEELLLQQHDT